MPEEKPKNTVLEVTFPVDDMRVWQKFMVGLRQENRFSLEEEPAKFIDNLLNYANKYKTKKFNKGKRFFRARINRLNDRKPFELSDLGAPPKEFARHGRLNPIGIPYLYLSSNQLTAVSEVRPWVGGKITVGEFVLTKDTNLINFSTKFFHRESTRKEHRGAEFTWKNLISWMFSAPFDPRDDTAYVPTQYLSERIKGMGFDGILYDSSLNTKGYNVTLFNSKSAVAKRRLRASVNSINLRVNYEKI